jgi:putative transposase
MKWKLTADLLIAFHPKYSIGQVVSMLKSISARELFREYPRIKKRLWSGQFWEDGYFARTVGNRMTRRIVEKYIKYHREDEQGLHSSIELRLRCPVVCHGEFH